MIQSSKELERSITKTPPVAQTLPYVLIPTGIGLLLLVWYFYETAPLAPAPTEPAAGFNIFDQLQPVLLAGAGLGAIIGGSLLARKHRLGWRFAWIASNLFFAVLIIRLVTLVLDTLNYIGNWGSAAANTYELGIIDIPILMTLLIIALVYTFSKRYKPPAKRKKATKPQRRR